VGVEGIRQRYETLDHWRGAAALLVMVFHSFSPWLEEEPEAFSGWLRILCLNGWIGVPVFFAVSGYCIAESVVRNLDRRLSVGGFLIDRGLRIYPAYWCALALASLIEVFASRFNHAPLFSTAESWGALPGSWWEVFLAVTSLETWFGGNLRLPVSWSLSYEVGFYLISGLCLAAMKLTSTEWPGLLLLLGTTALSLLQPVGAAIPLLSLWPQFAMGAIAWICLHRLPASKTIRLVVALTIFGAFISLADLIRPSTSTSLRVAAACALALVALQPLDSWIAGWRFLRWLGAIGTFSYSIYLVHGPIVGKFRNLSLSFWPSDHPWAAIVPLLGCLLALCIAFVFHRLIEARLERYRQRRARTGIGPSRVP
jgi:exopolysaccharide production protein ExoZ